MTPPETDEFGIYTSDDLEEPSRALVGMVTAFLGLVLIGAVYFAVRLA